MATKAKLYKDKFDLLELEIDERSPSVQDGLVYHYPFDGSIDKILDFVSIGTNPDGGVNSYVYKRIKTESYLIPSNAILVYDMYGYDMVDASGVTIECDSSGGAFRGGGILAYSDDGNSWSWCDCKGKWQTRVFPGFGEYMGGRTTTYWSLVDENNTANTNKVYFRNIRLEDSSGNVIHWIWSNEDTVENAIGYQSYRSAEITVTDMTTLQSNITYTPYGFSADTPTTNVIPDGDFSNGLQAPYTNFQNGTLEILDDYEHGGKLLRLVNENAGGEAYTQPYSGGYPLAAANLSETWTNSFYVKVETLNTSVSCWVMEQDSSGNYLSGGYSSKILQPEDGWIILEYSRTLSNPLVANITSRIDIDTHYGIANIKNWQLEKKIFASAFVNGARGLTDIRLNPNTVDLLEGSICFNATFHGETTVNLWPRMFEVGSYSNPITKDAVLIFRGNGWSTGNTVDFRFYSGILGTQKSTVYTGLSAIHDHNFFIASSWSASLKKVRGYIYDLTDGVVLKNTEISWAEFTGFSDWEGKFVFGGDYGNPSDAQYANLSIFNKYLTTEEITKLATNKMSMTQTKLITSNIIEKPKIPSSTQYYLPLDGGVNGIPATTETDIAYENGSAFVGSGTTNLILQADLSDFRAYPSLTFAIEDSEGFWTVPKGSDGEFLMSVTASITGGSTYTESFLLKHDGILNSLTITFFTNNGHHAIPATIRTITNNIKYISATYTSIATDTYIRAIDFSNVSGTLTTIGVKEAQLEAHAYSTPFVDGIRGAGSLHYPYEIIDCKTDFTIFGWWYPKTCADGYRGVLTRNPPNSNSTYNRIIIMSGPSDYRLRTWHGSDGISESAVYTPIDIPIIVDEWNFFAFIRLGTTLYLYIGNSGGFGYGSSETAYQLDSDETEQLWQVGEWSNYESDAYHRDYTFKQSATSSEDLEAIYRGSMTSNKDNLRINHQVREI